MTRKEQLQKNAKFSFPTMTGIKSTVAIDYHLGSIGTGMRQFGPQIVDALT